VASPFRLERTVLSTSKCQFSGKLLIGRRQPEGTSAPYPPLRLPAKDQTPADLVLTGGTVQWLVHYLHDF
jgi:hypothetical protein